MSFTTRDIGKIYRRRSDMPRPTDAIENSTLHEIDTEDDYRYNKHGRWELIPALGLKSKRLQTLLIPGTGVGYEIFGEPVSQAITAELHNSGCMIYKARTSASEFHTAASEGYMGLNDFANVDLLPKIQMVFSFDDTGANSATFIGLKDDALSPVTVSDVTAGPPDLTAVIGLGYRSTDTNYQIFHNDSVGAATVVDTLIPRDTNVYMLEIEYHTSTSVRLTLFDINMEVVFDDTYITEIPSTGIDIGFLAIIQNGNISARYGINMFDFIRLEKNKAPLSATTDF